MVAARREGRSGGRGLRCGIAWSLREPSVAVVPRDQYPAPLRPNPGSEGVTWCSPDVWVDGSTGYGPVHFPARKQDETMADHDGDGEAPTTGKGLVGRVKESLGWLTADRRVEAEGQL